MGSTGWATPPILRHGIGYDNNGNVISVQDGLSNVMARAFDPLNRLIIGPSLSRLYEAGDYAYDSQDHLAYFTDPRGNSTVYSHDEFGRLIQERSPDRGTTVYTPDGADNRVTETDARGAVTLRGFDALDRIISETFPGAPEEDIHYFYDATNGGNFGRGRLTGFTDETGSTALSYNERGEVISVARTIAAASYTTIYAYDLADHIRRIVYPSGDAVAYGRDAMGRIGSVRFEPASGPAHTLATDVAYLPFGPVSGLVYGNGLTRTPAYDLDYRLTNITTSGDSAIQNLSLRWLGSSVPGKNDIW